MILINGAVANCCQ